MRKVVLDTNVLVAGLLSPFGPCAQIVRMVFSGALTLCLDARILSEYDSVLRRPKFQFDTDKVDEILDYIGRYSNTCASSPLTIPLPDPGDEPFLEVALAAHACCLVTGNLVHFPTKLCRGVIVLSPAAFLDFYRKQTGFDT